jgi:hypothetical protein
MEIVSENSVDNSILENQDLMLISLEGWKTVIDSDANWLSGVPSVLIIKH